MPACDDFSPIGPNQKKTVAWRFAAPTDSFLPSSITLTGTPAITVTDAANVDPNPSQMIGTPQIGTFGSDPANTVVIVQIQNKGVNGAKYLFDVVVSQSDGDIAEAWNHMPCEAPA